MEVRTLHDRLTLVSLPQTMEGFAPFVGSWVYTGKTNLVVDVGPAASVGSLIGWLRDRGVRTVDYVLLSHIHIDHAGGTAEFLRSFPSARVVVQAKGLPHLTDPSKLWQGSLQTLGDMARAYGEIPPVPAEALIPHTQCAVDGLTVVETPGHAPHHLSYVYDGHLFAGEAAGVYLPDISPDYLRPPTPPRFIFEQALASVDRMLELDDQPICYAHFGSHPSSRFMLRRYREQLHLWLEIIREVRQQGDDPHTPQRCVSALLARDPVLAPFPGLDEAVRKREQYFIANSARGFLGYLAERSA